MLRKIETLTHFFAGRETVFQGSRGGCCLTLRNELSKETHVLTKQETLMGRGSCVESNRVSGSRRTATQPVVSSFTVMWLVSRSSLASHSDSGSFLVVCASLSQGGFQAGAFWEGRIMGWSLFSFWSFPDSASCGSLLVLHSSVGLSVVRLTHANRYYWEVLVSASPNNFILEKKHLKTRYPQRIILGTVELKIY